MLQHTRTYTILSGMQTLQPSAFCFLEHFERGLLSCLGAGIAPDPHDLGCAWFRHIDPGHGLVTRAFTLARQSMQPAAQFQRLHFQGDPVHVLLQWHAGPNNGPMSRELYWRLACCELSSLVSTLACCAVGRWHVARPCPKTTLLHFRLLYCKSFWQMAGVTLHDRAEPLE